MTSLKSLLLRLHVAIYAYFVKWFRTRKVVKAFASAHAKELTETPAYSWPVVLARQAKEMAAIKAGRLDAMSSQIVDRKSWAYPFMPASVNRLAIPIVKSTPYNIRRVSRTPVPRRAINLIKGAVISQPWEIRPIQGMDAIDDEDAQKERIHIVKKCFAHPNNQDSFQTYVEQGLEDMCILGGFVAEIGLTVDPERPFKSWPVNCESIRQFVSWSESTPDMPHYAQMTGLKGERGAILFYDDEMLYIKDNPSTDNPFGLGKCEVGFQSIIDFLGVQGMSGRAGSDQIHKCFPEWTEVLTRRGWLFWRDVCEDDEFATRSIDGEFQWQRALGFVKEWHEGDLIQFRNRNLRMTVTPKHRMYGQCSYGKDKKPLGFILADKLYAAATRKKQGNGKVGGKRIKQQKAKLSDFLVPACSVWNDGVLPSPEIKIGDKTFSWEDWAAFLGIWMAEGSVLGAGRERPQKGEYRIQIAQSKRANKATYKKIESLLKRMGITYYAKNDRLLFTDRAIWAYLSAFGHSHTKYVPQWVKDAPAPIIRLFVDWAWMGDGTRGTYHTVSKRLADDMQELLQKLGVSAAIVPHINRDCVLDGQIIHGAGHVVYYVQRKRRRNVRIFPLAGSKGKQRMPQRISYSGLVYCAMVPNGTLYCRENGYAFWSGNTFLWWEAPQNESHYQIVRRHIQNDLEGQAKLSIIGGMKKPEVVEVTPVSEQDLLLNWQELLIRMIANAFDMSGMALGIEHDVNRAVGEVLDDKDFRSAVVPMAKRLQEAFTRKILHQKLGWFDLEFAFLNLDDPDIETKIGMYTKLYSINATTPNRVLKALNMQELDSPFADLTQFECMLLNIEAMENQQNDLADAQVQRQLTVQQIQQRMNPPQPSPDAPTPDTEQQKQIPGKQQKALPPGSQPQSPAGGAPPSQGLEKLTPGSVARGGQPPSPKPLQLPHFPIAGSRHSAQKIAMMPVNQVQDVWTATGMTMLEFLGAMDDNQPGILERLSEELKDFFEEQLEEESQPKKKVSQKLLKQWKQDLVKRVSKTKKRPYDYTRFLTKLGRSGKPGAYSDSGGVRRRLPIGGKPGNLNPTKRI